MYQPLFVTLRRFRRNYRAFTVLMNNLILPYITFRFCYYETRFMKMQAKIVKTLGRRKGSRKYLGNWFHLCDTSRLPLTHWFPYLRRLKQHCLETLIQMAWSIPLATRRQSYGFRNYYWSNWLKLKYSAS